MERSTGQPLIDGRFVGARRRPLDPRMVSVVRRAECPSGVTGLGLSPGRQGRPRAGPGQLRRMP
ncbi:hypothetical protein QFZ33_002510 [Arthrobacter globiformis]|nr:hypothetical protein [Arthrobacter globiformis]